MVYSFSNVVVDTEKYEIRVDGINVKVEPLLFDLLAYFLKNADKVLSRDKLLDEVWSGRLVSDSTIAGAIKNLRLAIGDNGKEQKYIKTVHGRGFRFVGHISGTEKVIDAESLMQTSRSSNEDQHNIPLILVLPFKNLSDDPVQKYLSDGLTEDIVTEFSRFHAVSVSSVSTSFHVAESGLDPQQIREKLSVDYVIEGSVRKMGEQIRIAVRLINTIMGNSIWTQKYDYAVEKIYAFQDDVTRNIVSTVSGRMESHMSDPVRDDGNRDGKTYDAILRAQALYYSQLYQPTQEAKEILEQVIQQTPNSARAHSLLAMIEETNAVMNWVQSPKDTYLRAFALAKTAVTLCNTDARNHARLAMLLVGLGRLDEAFQHIEKSRVLNPNDSEALVLQYGYYIAIGDPDTAIEIVNLASEIDPYERFCHPWLRGKALFAAKKFDQAASALLEMVEPTNVLNLTLAACYGHLGKTEEGKRTLDDFLEKAHIEMPYFPGTALVDWHDFLWFPNSYANKDYFDLQISGLEKCWRIPT